MPAPVVAVCVGAAIAGVAAFVFEPHIAPAIERWAEDFLAKRRARRRGPVPFPSTRGSGHGDPGPSGANPRKEPLQEKKILSNYKASISIEWRNQVYHTAPGTVIPDTDEGSISNTMNESITSLTHTPLSPTHFISNVSSPIMEAHSVSTRTPSRAHSRASSRTAKDGEREGNTLFFAPSSPSSSAPPSPPFGPILPDTPRTSAAYSARPFSPVVRTPVHSRVPSSRPSLRHLNSSSSSRVGVDMQGRRVNIDVVGEHVNFNINSSVNTRMQEGMSANTSVVDSLSERYPAPPTPPVLLSPPSSHTTSSPSTDILSLGSSGSQPGSPFDMVSPPVRIGEVHLPSHTSLSGAVSSLSPLMSEHDFMAFGEASDLDGAEILASPSGSTRLHNPFTDFDEGNDSDSGSEGSWRRLSVTSRR
ncbi:uncharacterized protein BJ212DRAFT_1405906 [Suillus subaureus]|uniref:Uncharacterized protein n=1 Tax=Suillus subaureus TaxID=48587 RepID=A0A9P7IYR6_9AGAM|nr:uncharacterized protein BJ212DRAFT_1405906 [Suillus subaureus]KAG1797572.1 hypothetical protein BJ212DRAFT_1405906 [Suillus subaureus]